MPLPFIPSCPAQPSELFLGFYVSVVSLANSCRLTQSSTNFLRFSCPKYLNSNNKVTQRRTNDDNRHLKRLLWKNCSNTPMKSVRNIYMAAIQCPTGDDIFTQVMLNRRFLTVTMFCISSHSTANSTHDLQFQRSGV